MDESSPFPLKIASLGVYNFLGQSQAGVFRNTSLAPVPAPSKGKGGATMDTGVSV